MKRFYVLAVLLAVLIAAACIVHVTIAYIGMLNSTTSAPASVAFLIAIPYALADLAAIVAAIILKKRTK